MNRREFLKGTAWMGAAAVAAFGLLSIGLAGGSAGAKDLSFIYGAQAAEGRGRSSEMPYAPIGAGEFDWRPAYASRLGGSRAAVVSASSGVMEHVLFANERLFAE